MEYFFGEKCGMKNKFESDRRKRKAVETVVTYEVSLPNDKSEETSKGTATAREELGAGISRAKKINWEDAEIGCFSRKQCNIYASPGNQERKM
eukprot:156994-Ditylum_brightwellii.AAC.2